MLRHKNISNKNKGDKYTNQKLCYRFENPEKGAVKWCSNFCYFCTQCKDGMLCNSISFEQSSIQKLGTTKVLKLQKTFKIS